MLTEDRYELKMGLTERTPTMIEEWIGDFTETGNVGKGRKLTGGFATADCMKLVCGKKEYCVGSDKIGHMFQQGHMLYEIEQAKGIAYAEAFSKWTEGLYVTPDMVYGRAMDADIDLWLRNNGFSHFYGMFGNQDIRINELKQKWGGQVGQGIKGLAQTSPGDNAANLGGMKFYDKLMSESAQGRRVRFDVCDYVDPTWVKDK